MTLLKTQSFCGSSCFRRVVLISSAKIDFLFAFASQMQRAVRTATTLVLNVEIYVGTAKRAC